MNENSSQILIELAREFMSFLNAFYPGWEKAYYRFHYTETHYGSCGSYICGGNVELFDPFGAVDTDVLFDTMNSNGAYLANSLKKAGEKVFSVFLLAVDSAEYNFDFKFEYDDINKWEISMMDGGTGIPAGIPI